MWCLSCKILTQTQLEFPTVMGQPYETLPEDLFIPPNALELCLRDILWANGPSSVFNKKREYKYFRIRCIKHN